MTLPPAVIRAPFAATIFFFPVALFFGFLVLCLIECDYYWALRNKEGILENIQAVLYLGAFVIGVISAKRAFECRRMTVFWLLALFSVGTFFVFGEEISWGQTLFGLDPPEFFRQHNQQGDLTFHNLRVVENGKWHHKAFLLVGLYGAFAWLATRNVSASSTWQFLVPPWFLSLYFLPAAIWYGGNKTYVKWVGIPGNHQETVELLLALGIFLLAACNLRRFSVPTKDIVAPSPLSAIAQPRA
jgi:hypothetical protein